MAYLLWIPGLCLLLLEPAIWLTRTWRDPSYGSAGAMAAAMVALLGIASVASGPASPTRTDRRIALGLLLLTSSVRLAGGRLDVVHLSAMALVLDVASLGLLLALHRRPWAVHPGWWAGLFALSLPIEQMLQRLVSYPMRLGSAVVVEALLSPLRPDLVRRGTILSDPGGILSVDLPCSGAVGLTVLGIFATAAACRRIVGPASLALGVAAVGGGALVANVLRLIVLLVGPTETLLLEPWHGAVGLVGIGAGALPALALARRLPTRAALPRRSAEPPRRASWAHAAGGIAFSLLAVGIVGVQPRPLDVSRALAGAQLPSLLGPHTSTAEALSEPERAYFERFGGNVERRRYSSGHTVLLVQTTAPLRHLHLPAACLRGIGLAVSRLGVRHDAIPTTVWRAVDREGDAWRVEASFVSSGGQVAESAAEVAWRWMQRPGETWSLIERITPFEQCERDPVGCASFDRILYRALDASPVLTSRRTP